MNNTEDSELDAILDGMSWVTTSFGGKEKAKNALQDLLLKARLDELENHSVIDTLHGTGLVFTSNQLRKISQVFKAERKAELTAQLNQKEE